MLPEANRNKYRKTIAALKEGKIGKQPPPSLPPQPSLAAEEPPKPPPPAAKPQAAPAKSNAPRQQAHLKNLIGATLYDKLVAKGGIVLDGDGHVVEFRVYDKDGNRLLEDDERKQLTCDIAHLKSLLNLTVIYFSDTGVSGDKKASKASRKWKACSL